MFSPIIKETLHEMPKSLSYLLCNVLYVMLVPLIIVLVYWVVSLYDVDSLCFTQLTASCRWPLCTFLQFSVSSPLACALLFASAFKFCCSFKHA